MNSPFEPWRDEYAARTTRWSKHLQGRHVHATESLGRENVQESLLLERGSQGRPLRRDGATSALRCRDAKRTAPVPLVASAVVGAAYSSSSSEFAEEDQGCEARSGENAGITRSIVKGLRDHGFRRHRDERAGSKCFEHCCHVGPEVT